jgi:hypothetical protein
MQIVHEIARQFVRRIGNVLTAPNSFCNVKLLQSFMLSTLLRKLLVRHSLAEIQFGNLKTKNGCISNSHFQVEQPVPEQFKTVIAGKKLKTVITESV